MKNLIYILIFLPLICIGQTISIDGSLHSTNGGNTFPIWVEEGTTIQPNYPIKSISIKEFNVVPNSSGNDLVFNKTVLVYSDSISTVPEGKTWKLESIQNELQIGDEYAGGIVFYLDGNGGGKVISPIFTHIYSSWYQANGYADDLDINGYDDWYLPSPNDLKKISRLNILLNLFSEEYAWTSETYSNFSYGYVVNIFNGQENTYSTSNEYHVIPIRQF